MQTPGIFTLFERDFRIEFTDLGKAQLRRSTQQLGGVWATETHREELGRQGPVCSVALQARQALSGADNSIQIVDEYTAALWRTDRGSADCTR